MTIRILLWALAAAMIAEVFFYTPHARSEDTQIPVPTLSDRQLAWSYALEWCESQAIPTAINKVDRDGTPSYGIYQFKPGTLQSYAKLYSIVVSDDVMSTSSQRAVLEAMILDARHIDWHQQFPVCVEQLGRPPVE